MAATGLVSRHGVEFATLRVCRFRELHRVPFLPHKFPSGLSRVPFFWPGPIRSHCPGPIPIPGPIFVEPSPTLHLDFKSSNERQGGTHARFLCIELRLASRSCPKHHHFFSENMHGDEHGSCARMQMHAPSVDFPNHSEK